MQFIPQWISDVPINDVRVQIVLPPDVTVTMSKPPRTSTMAPRPLRAIGGLLGKTSHTTKRTVYGWRFFSSAVHAKL